MDLYFQISFGAKKVAWKFGANWALIWRLLAQNYFLNGRPWPGDLGPSASCSAWIFKKGTMKHTSLRNLVFLIIEDLVYACMVHNILHNVRSCI